MDEFAEEIPEEPPGEKPSLLKKAFIAVIGVFLLFLILTYFLGYAAFDNIPGLVESSRISNSAINLKDGSIIVFEEAVYRELRETFTANEGNETKMCLIGIKNGNFLITTILQPVIISQDFRSVTSMPCPEGTIISLHTHPMMHCTPSLQDYKSLHSHKDAEFAAVVCTGDRIYIY